MKFDSIFTILSTLLLILPGFLIVKFKESIKEYKSLDNLETTIYSIFYSISVLLIWIIINILFEFSNYIKYKYLITLKSLIINNNFESLFNIKIVFAISTYLIAFIFISLGVFIWNWIHISYQIKKFIGFKKLSKNLTPWEDFIHDNYNKWISINLKNGYTYLGKFAKVSYYPFDKEIIITGEDKSPIDIFYNNKKVELKENDRLDQMYINGEEIHSMTSYKFKELPNEDIKKTNILNKIFNINLIWIFFIYLFSFIASIMISILLPLLFFEFIIVNLLILSFLIILDILSLILLFNFINKYEIKLIKESLSK